MSHEAVDHRQPRYDRARQIGSPCRQTRTPSYQRNQRWQRCRPENDPSAVHYDAACPFVQIVAFGLEYEPLISEKGDRDVDQVGQQARRNIAVSEPWLE